MSSLDAHLHPSDAIKLRHDKNPTQSSKLLITDYDQDEPRPVHLWALVALVLRHTTVFSGCRVMQPSVSVVQPDCSVHAKGSSHVCTTPKNPSVLLRRHPRKAWHHMLHFMAQIMLTAVQPFHQHSIIRGLPPSRLFIKSIPRHAFFHNHPTD